MDTIEKMDCSAKGEVILEVGQPRQPHWEHLGCLRIKKGGNGKPVIPEPSMVFKKIYPAKAGLPPSVLRTPHVMERRFREVPGRSQPMGTFSHRTRMETYSVFTHENLKQRTATPFLLLTQKIILP